VDEFKPIPGQVADQRSTNLSDMYTRLTLHKINRAIGRVR